MVLTADNDVGADIGDTVEIELETVNLLSASLIAYGLPLLSLMLGIFAGYFGLLALGMSDGISQAVGAFTGLIAMALTFAAIKYNEDKIKNMKKFKPQLVGVKPKDGD